MSEHRDGVYELTIDGLGSDGEGVGRMPDGRVVFVPGALPGDTARVRLERSQRRVQYAELLTLVAPSALREVSRCDVAHCGGCSIKALSLVGHAELKRQRLVETMRRIGKLDVAHVTAPLVQVGDGWQYRHRVRLHAEWQGRRWRLGYHERRSHRLVAIERCPVLWPELERAVVALDAQLHGLDRDVALREIDIVYSRLDARAAARLHCDGSPISAKSWMAGVTGSTEVRGIDLVGAHGRLQEGNVMLRYDHRRSAEFDLLYEPGLFTQANPSLNDRLVDAVITALRPQSGTRILELHAGIGNFSLPLARAGATLVSAEVDKRTVLMARRSARQAGMELEQRVSTDRATVVEAEQYDAVLLDPPRTGARAAVEELARRGPGRIAYVSCDPATLARDVADLVAGKYKLVSLQPFDMFPRTAHVEALAVLDATA